MKIDLGIIEKISISPSLTTFPKGKSVVKTIGVHLKFTTGIDTYEVITRDMANKLQKDLVKILSVKA